MAGARFRGIDRRNVRGETTRSLAHLLVTRVLVSE
jgi:hypothetical protein